MYSRPCRCQIFSWVLYTYLREVLYGMDPLFHEAQMYFCSRLDRIKTRTPLSCLVQGQHRRIFPQARSYVRRHVHEMVLTWGICIFCSFSHSDGLAVYVDRGIAFPPTSASNNKLGIAVCVLSGAQISKDSHASNMATTPVAVYAVLEDVRWIRISKVVSFCSRWRPKKEEGQMHNVQVTECGGAPSTYATSTADQTTGGCSIFI